MMNKEQNTNTNREIIKLIDYFKSDEHSTHGKIRFKGFFSNMTKYGISYLLFDADNSNIAWSVSGKCAKELEKVLPVEWINEIVEIKFYKNYHSRYDIYYVMLEDIPVVVVK